MSVGFLIYTYSVLVYNIMFTVGWRIQPRPVFRQPMWPRDPCFLMGNAHENVPSTGRSIVFHPNLMPDRSGWCDLIWFIMSSWPLSPVLALKEMGNRWICGGWGSKMVLAEENGEYVGKKSHFQLFRQHFFNLYLLLLHVPCFIFISSTSSSLYLPPVPLTLQQC